MLAESANQIVAATSDEYVVHKLMRHIYGNAYQVTDSERRCRTVKFNKQGSSTCTCKRSACDHRLVAGSFDELHPRPYGDRIHVISRSQAMSTKSYKQQLTANVKVRHATAPLAASKPPATVCLAGHGQIPID